MRDRDVEGRITVAEGEIDLFLAEQETSKDQDNAAEYELSHILVRVPEQPSPGQLAGRGGSRSRLDEAKGRRATAPSADTDTAHARALHTQAVWSHAASFSWCRSTMPSLELSCHFMSARRGQSAGPISNL